MGNNLGLKRYVPIYNNVQYLTYSSITCWNTNPSALNVIKHSIEESVKIINKQFTDKHCGNITF